MLRYFLSLCITKQYNSRRNVTLYSDLQVHLTIPEMEDFHGDTECSKVQATCLGPQTHLFEIRHFLKVFSCEVSLIDELQNQVGGPCVWIRWGGDGQEVLYTVQHTGKTVGWSVKCEEVPGSGRAGPYVTAALEACVRLSAAGLQTVERTVVQLLSRALLLHPGLHLSCESRGKALLPDRSRNQGDVKPVATWLGQLRIYCRVYTDSSEAIHMGQTSKRTTTDGVTVLYARSARSSIGALNHLHVCVRGADGLPADLDAAEWCSLVQVPSPVAGVRVALGSPVCSRGTWLPDACYPVLGDLAPACYLAVLVLEPAANTVGTSFLQQQRHGDIGRLLAVALASMITSAKNDQGDDKLCDMSAAAVGSVLRFSLNHAFRNQCYQLLQASCTAQAKQSFLDRLRSTVRSPSQLGLLCSHPWNKSPSQTCEKDASGSKKSQSPSMLVAACQASREEALQRNQSSSPCGSDLTDDEQFLRWDSPRATSNYGSESGVSLAAQTQQTGDSTHDAEQFLDWDSPRTMSNHGDGSGVSLASQAQQTGDSTHDAEQFLDWDSPQATSNYGSESGVSLAAQTQQTGDSTHDAEQFLDWDSPRTTSNHGDGSGVSLASQAQQTGDSTQDAEQFLDWDSPRATSNYGSETGVSLAAQTQQTGDSTHDAEQFLDWDSPRTTSNHGDGSGVSLASPAQQTGDSTHDAEQFLDWDLPRATSNYGSESGVSLASQAQQTGDSTHDAEKFLEWDSPRAASNYGSEFGISLAAQAQQTGDSTHDAEQFLDWNSPQATSNHGDGSGVSLATQAQQTGDSTCDAEQFLDWDSPRATSNYGDGSGVFLTSQAQQTGDFTDDAEQFLEWSSPEFDQNCSQATSPCTIDEESLGWDSPTHLPNTVIANLEE